MIDEEKLKKHIEDKCYEVKHREAVYNSRKRDMEVDWKKYTENIVGESLVAERANNLKDSFNEYASVKFETKQLCYALGSEYVDIYKRIVGED